MQFRSPWLPRHWLLMALPVIAGLPATGARFAAAQTQEAHECCTVERLSIRVGANHLARALLTRPKDGRQSLPGILFIGWLSCDSVELKPGATDGWSLFLNRLVTDSGAVVLRVDKPGVGGSDGDCGATDFETEVDVYRRAWQVLKGLPGVDASRMAVVGGSIGGAIAPLVVRSEPIRAVVVWGTVAKTWLEHMLELERRRLTFSGQRRPGAPELRALAEFHGRMLHNHQSPAEVIRDRPLLRSVWYGEADGLYGRPARYFHQLQDLDLLDAWRNVQAPVLAVHGEYDWIMSRGDHELIVEQVNAAHPGVATFLSIAGTNHHFMTYDSAQEAFDERGGTFSVTAANAITEFLRTKLGQGDVGRRSNSDLFDELIGDWSVDVSYENEARTVASASGTWRFGRTLDGHAIQDDWRVTRQDGVVSQGTTIRFYDPAADAWRVTWHGVTAHTVFRFLARRSDGNIVQEGQEPGEFSRWVFSDVTAESFQWRALSSSDHGQTWSVDQRVEARRLGQWPRR